MGCIKVKKIFWKKTLICSSHWFIVILFLPQGYRYRKAYIATQGPLAETTEDFWRMLWEHNSTIIVMLTKLKEMGRVSPALYWNDAVCSKKRFLDMFNKFSSSSFCVDTNSTTVLRNNNSVCIFLFLATKHVLFYLKTIFQSQ